MNHHSTPTLQRRSGVKSKKKNTDSEADLDFHKDKFQSLMGNEVTH